MRLGLATIFDERPGWPLQKVWPGGQCFQVTHNDMLSRRITSGGVRGVHVTEVHGFGRLVPSETPTADTLPRVWS